MASKQRHDWGWRKRQASAPIQQAALSRRQMAKAGRQSHPQWFLTWLRTNKLPNAKEFAEWEASLNVRN